MRPRAGSNDELEKMLGKYVNELKRKEIYEKKTDVYSELRKFDWWIFTIGEDRKPEKGYTKPLKTTKCDFCTNVYFCEGSLNKRKNGFPVYRLCDHCIMWSLPKAKRMYAKKLDGNISKPISSGKKVSKSLRNTYRKVSKSAQIKEKQCKESDEKDAQVKLTKRQHEEVENSSYVEKTTEAVKDAVHVVETGVTGLINGASDAISSLSPFGKTKTPKTSPNASPKKRSK